MQSMKNILFILILSVVSGVGMMKVYSSKPKETKIQDTQKQDKKQKQRRSVYTGLNNPRSEKIKDIAAVTKGDVWIEREVGLPVLTPNSATSFDLQSFLTGRACDADAIITGTVTSASSEITEDGSFLFTAHEFQIAEILKDNSLSPMNTGGAITVLRTGGSIPLNGKRIVAEYKGAKPLEIGKRYLLFLGFLPEKNAYAADNIGYEIKKDKIVKLTHQKLEHPLESGNDANAFISSVRAAIVAPCNPGGAQ